PALEPGQAGGGEDDGDGGEPDQGGGGDVEAGCLGDVGEWGEVQEPVVELEGGADGEEYEVGGEHAPGGGCEAGCQAEQRDREPGQRPDCGQLHHGGAERAGQPPAEVAGVQPVGQPGGQSGGGQGGGRAQYGEGEVAARPSQPAHRGGQDGLGPPAALLGLQFEGGLDRVDGGDQPEQGHHGGEEGVDECAPTAHPGEDVLQILIVLAHVADALGDAAEHRSEHREPGGPGGQQAAVQPPGQGQWAAQAGCSGGRAGAGRHQAGAAGAPGGQGDRRGGEHGGEAGDEREHPPALVAVGLELVDQADRRHPGQPREGTAGVAAEVAGDAQQVGGAEDGDGDSAGAGRAGGQLRGDGPDAGEQPAGRGEFQAEGH